jgi:hypothetical protein
MRVINKSHFTGVSTFASHTSPSTAQSLQKSFHLSSPDKIELKKISSPSENKKYATAQPNDTQKSIAMQTPKSLTGKHFNYSVDRRPACNSTYPKGGVSCSKNSFVVHQTLVFQIKFCGKSPALRVAAKRQAVK